MAVTETTTLPCAGAKDSSYHPLMPEAQSAWQIAQKRYQVMVQPRGTGADQDSPVTLQVTALPAVPSTVLALTSLTSPLDAATNGVPLLI